MENSQCQCIDDLYIFIHLKKQVIFLSYLKFTRGMFFCGLYKASAYETPQNPVGGVSTPTTFGPWQRLFLAGA
jgi:hypothetical protein